jgi:hypothetical protein
VTSSLCLLLTASGEEYVVRLGQSGSLSLVRFRVELSARSRSGFTGVLVEVEEMGILWYFFYDPGPKRVGYTI